MSSQTTAPAVPAEHRILRRAEVEAKTGFKRAHIYSLMKEGKFPKALRLGVRALEAGLGFDLGAAQDAVLGRQGRRDGLRRHERHSLTLDGVVQKVPRIPYAAAARFTATAEHATAIAVCCYRLSAMPPGGDAPVPACSTAFAR